MVPHKSFDEGNDLRERIIHVEASLNTLCGQIRQQQETAKESATQVAALTRSISTVEGRITDWLSRMQGMPCRDHSKKFDELDHALTKTASELLVLQTQVAEQRNQVAEQISPLRLLVYGAVAIILSAVLGALVNFVLTRNHTGRASLSPPAASETNYIRVTSGSISNGVFHGSIAVIPNYDPAP